MQEGTRVSRLLKEARLWGPVAGLFLLDQVSKELAFRCVDYGDRRAVIDGLLYVTPRVNPGLMWSLLGGTPNFVFIMLTVGVVGLLLYYHYRSKDAPDRWGLAALALVLGGALGNLFDRMPFIASGVRDFVDVVIPIIRYDYPVFNLADGYILAGVVIYLVAGFKKGRKD